MFVLPPWMYIIRCKILCIKRINYIDIHMQSERKTVRRAKLNIGLCDYRLYRCVQHESSERRQLLFKQHKWFRLSWRIRRDHFEHICLIISTKKRIIPSCTSLFCSVLLGFLLRLRVRRYASISHPSLKNPIIQLESRSDKRQGDEQSTASTHFVSVLLF